MSELDPLHDMEAAQVVQPDFRHLGMLVPAGDEDGQLCPTSDRDLDFSANGKGDSDNSEDGSDALDDASVAAETIWSRDIEDAFEEALAIYPPCGRRKIILSEDGQMYGRNELISRYIFKRTNKRRTRKQVSSHIQVLNRKRMRDQRKSSKQVATDSVSVSHTVPQKSSLFFSEGGPDGTHGHMSPRGCVVPDKSTSSDAQLGLASHGLSTPGSGVAIPHTQSSLAWEHAQAFSLVPTSPIDTGVNTPRSAVSPAAASGGLNSQWHPCLFSLGNLPKAGIDGSEAPRVMLRSFALFVDPNPSGSPTHLQADKRYYILQMDEAPSHEEINSVEMRNVADKFPGICDVVASHPRAAYYLVKFWGNINPGFEDGLYGAFANFETSENIKSVAVTTTVHSFGEQVLQRTTQLDAVVVGGTALFSLQSTPLCEDLVGLIKGLRNLQSVQETNEVLDYFSVTQTVFRPATCEVVLCVCYMFAVTEAGNGECQFNICRMVSSQ
eukprot:Opistho-2@85965